MKNYKTITLSVMLTLLLISSIYVWFERDSILLGKKELPSLEKNIFRDLKVSLLAPSDWRLFNVTKSNIRIESIDKYLIIEGNNPLSVYPKLKIYQFNKIDFDEDAFTIDNIIEMDLRRIHDQYQNQTVDIITDEKTSQKILYQFLSDEVLFKTEKISITCKDHFTDQEKCILIISICATNDQWTQLNEVYDPILQSITLWE